VELDHVDLAVAFPNGWSVLRAALRVAAEIALTRIVELTIAAL
jgi:hypothetical protein